MFHPIAVGHHGRRRFAKESFLLPYISFKAFSGATDFVVAEMRRVGILHSRSRLWKTDVVWCQWPQISGLDVYGFVFDGDNLGWLDRALYEPGHIYIPATSLVRLVPFKNHPSLRELIRHEYAHAIAYHYGGLVRGSHGFRRAFAGHYDDERARRDWDKRDVVSNYALTSPAEDFAETFACWYWRPGAPRGATSALKAKIRFVRYLISRLRFI